MTELIIKLLSVDARKPLYKVTLFWLPVVVFVGYALFLSYPLMCLCSPKPSEYKLLLEQLGLPIFVASLAIPFTVAIARFHSSKQIAYKINLDEKNENFKLYYEHKKLFCEFLERKVRKKMIMPGFEMENEEFFYKSIFPRNTPKGSCFEVDFKDLNSVILHRTLQSIESIKMSLEKRRGEAESYELAIKIAVEIIHLSIQRDILYPFGMRLTITPNQFLHNKNLNLEYIEGLISQTIPTAINVIASFDFSDQKLKESIQVELDYGSKILRNFHSSNIEKLIRELHSNLK